LNIKNESKERKNKQRKNAGLARLEWAKRLEGGWRAKILA
jgi:hypothetical protein